MLDICWILYMDELTWFSKPYKVVTIIIHILIGANWYSVRSFIHSFCLSASDYWVPIMWPEHLNMAQLELNPESTETKAQDYFT